MLSFGKKSAPFGDDWVTDASGFIESTIDTVRDKVVIPLITIAKGIVYGVLIATAATVALTVFGIALVRLLDVYLDNIPGTPENVWFAYLVSGAIFIAVGLLLWTKRKPTSQES